MCIITSFIGVSVCLCVCRRYVVIIGLFVVCKVSADG